MPDVQDVDRVVSNAVKDAKGVSNHRDHAQVSTLDDPWRSFRSAPDALDHL
jgi:hypothetical protein